MIHYEIQIGHRFWHLINFLNIGFKLYFVAIWPGRQIHKCIYVVTFPSNTEIQWLSYFLWGFPIFIFCHMLPLYLLSPVSDNVWISFIQKHRFSQAIEVEDNEYNTLISGLSFGCFITSTSICWKVEMWEWWMIKQWGHNPVWATWYRVLLFYQLYWQADSDFLQYTWQSITCCNQLYKGYAMWAATNTFWVDPGI